MNRRVTRTALLPLVLTALLPASAAMASDGAADPGWTRSTAGAPEGTLALLTDHHGRPVEVSTDHSERLTRLTTAGATDVVFGQGQTWTPSYIGGAAVTGDDGVVTGGSDPQNQQVLVHRWTSTGSVDKAFGGDGEAAVPMTSAAVGSVAALRDGSVLVSGEHGSSHRAFVMKLSPAGTLDTSWAPTSEMPGVAFDVGGAAVLLPTNDGGVLASGRCETTCLTRLTSTGARDDSYGAGGTAPGFGQQYSTVLGAGLLLADGTATVFGVDSSARELRVIRYTPSGQLDSTFGDGGVVRHQIAACATTTPYCNVHVTAVATDPAGRTYVSTQTDDNRVYRLMPNGDLDASFGSGGSVTHDDGIVIPSMTRDGAGHLLVSYGGRISALQTGETASTTSGTGTPTPAATSFPCAKPSAHFFRFSPTRVASGDVVRVTGSVQDLCHDSQPSESFTVYAKRAQDASPVAVATTTSDNHGSFAVDITAGETETLSVIRGSSDPLYYYGDVAGGAPVLTVDRVSGSCAGVVRLSAAPAVRLGDSVLLTGQRSDTSTVTIQVRRRGGAYAGLPTSAPDAGGRFAARYTADDDYAVFAAGQRCDSPPVVIQIHPTISGPATARRGASVTLTVTGLPTAPVAVYFHKAGATGYAKRRLSSLGKNGVYTTTFVPDADYRYYAAVGNDHRTSNGGLTQLR